MRTSPGSAVSSGSSVVSALGFSRLAEQRVSKSLPLDIQVAGNCSTGTQSRRFSDCSGGYGSDLSSFSISSASASSGLWWGRAVPENARWANAEATLWQWQLGTANESSRH